MTTTDGFEWPTGDPLFNLSLRIVSEALAGNGNLVAGGFEVTATANANEIQVGTGELLYDGTHYALGTAETFTLSANSSGSDRWDLVAFDVNRTDANGNSDPGPIVREGTAGANPEPPDLQAGEVGLAYVYLADGENDVTGSEIKNFRAWNQRADATYTPDAKGLYAGDTVEDALQTELETAAKLSSYPLPIGDLNAPYSLPNIADMDLDGNPLSDTAGPGTIYDATTGKVVQSVLGGPAGSLSSYPLPDGDISENYAIAPVPLSELDAPYGLPNISDMDAAGNNLNDSAGPGTLYDATAGEIVQSVLGGPASSLTSYPLPIGDLNAPYALPSITDMDAAGSNLTDSAGPGTVYDAAAGEVPRGVVDRDRVTASVAADVTTSGEEVLFVDTSAARTITLASADAVDGREIRIKDETGSAGTNAITVQTEGSETIDGGSSRTIGTNYGALTLVSDGTNWFVLSEA